MCIFTGHRTTTRQTNCEIIVCFVFKTSLDWKRQSFCIIWLALNRLHQLKFSRPGMTFCRIEWHDQNTSICHLDVCNSVTLCLQEVVHFFLLKPSLICALCERCLCVLGWNNVLFKCCQTSRFYRKRLFAFNFRLICLNIWLEVDNDPAKTTNSTTHKPLYQWPLFSQCSMAPNCKTVVVSQNCNNFHHLSSPWRCFSLANCIWLFAWTWTVASRTESHTESHTELIAILSVH